MLGFGEGGTPPAISRAHFREGGEGYPMGSQTVRAALLRGGGVAVQYICEKNQ